MHTDKTLCRATMYDFIAVSESSTRTYQFFPTFLSDACTLQTRLKLYVKTERAMKRKLEERAIDIDWRCKKSRSLISCAARSYLLALIAVRCSSDYGQLRVCLSRLSLSTTSAAYRPLMPRAATINSTNKRSSRPRRYRNSSH